MDEIIKNGDGTVTVTKDIPATKDIQTVDPKSLQSQIDSLNAQITQLQSDCDTEVLNVQTEASDNIKLIQDQIDPLQIQLNEILTAYPDVLNVSGKDVLK